MSAQERCITWCDTAVFAVHEGFTPTVKTSACHDGSSRTGEDGYCFSSSFEMLPTSSEQRACRMYWWHYAKGAQSYTTVSSVFSYKELQ